MSILVPATPTARKVIAQDGVKLATYEFGDQNQPPVLAVHGFASSAVGNWSATGWTRDLTRAGYRVIALDQRGHGASDKPHLPAAYSMEVLVSDLLTVLNAYLIDEVRFLGYSLGARVGWQASIDLSDRITSAVLGGIPDGQPLSRVRTEQARAHIERGTPVDDVITNAYLTMASRTAENDLAALMDLVDGMRDSPQPDPGNPPQQEILFATGSEDGILERSKRLAASAPRGRFSEIPGRNHFNAPTSRPFRDTAIEFLKSRDESHV